MHIYAQKFVARKLGCTANVDFWKLTRIRFRKQLKLKLKNITVSYIPLGIIIAFIVYILSNMQIVFAAITSLNIQINKTYRLGKKYVHLTNLDSAKIAVVGPLTNILLALLASPINSPLIKPFIIINITLAVSYMLPLPGIAGGTVFFGSKPLYILSLVFIGIIALLMNYISVISSIIIAFIFALAAVIAYLKFYE